MTITPGPSTATFHGLSAGKISQLPIIVPGPATPPGTPPTVPASLFIGPESVPPPPPSFGGPPESECAPPPPPPPSPFGGTPVSEPPWPPPSFPPSGVSAPDDEEQCTRTIAQPNIPRRRRETRMGSIVRGMLGASTAIS